MLLELDDWVVNNYPKPKPLDAPQLGDQSTVGALQEALTRQLSYLDFKAGSLTIESMRELSDTFNVIINKIKTLENLERLKNTL